MTLTVHPTRPAAAAPAPATAGPSPSAAPPWPFGHRAAPARRDAQLVELTLATVRQARLPLMAAWRPR